MDKKSDTEKQVEASSYILLRPLQLNCSLARYLNMAFTQSRDVDELSGVCVLLR